MKFEGGDWTKVAQHRT